MQVPFINAAHFFLQNFNIGFDGSIFIFISNTKKKSTIKQIIIKIFKKVNFFFRSNSISIHLIQQYHLI